MRKLLIATSCVLALLSSCNREAYEGTQLSPEADSAIKADWPSARKVKFMGPVNITLQHGNNNVATPTATGKVKADAAATGPGSTASATSAGTPWYVFAGLVLIGAALGFWGRARWPL
jgi:hypothetical protein